MSLTGFRITQGFYWLFLGVWIGALVMLAIGAAVTFKTVRHYEPALGLEPYNDPVLAPHAPGILAGAITGNALRSLAVVQMICAAGAAVCVVLQCTVFRGALSNGVGGLANLVRIALVALPIVVLAIDQLAITPRIWEHRAVMYNPILSDEQRSAARETFQKYHKLSERVVGMAVLSLAAAVLVSPFAFRAGESNLTPTGKDVARG